MEPVPDYILFGISLMLVLSVFASKVAERFGIPALLLFLALGMLLGSEGPGGIYFDDPALAQFIGVVALALILFSGGLYTDWNSVRPVLWQGAILSTLPLNPDPGQRLAGNDELILIGTSEAEKLFMAHYPERAWRYQGFGLLDCLWPGFLLTFRFFKAY